MTFLVVDLETTGASPATSSITEIGAVRVRGGEVLAELSTLVRPAEPIPREIAVLTGITDAMVAGAPPVAAVLPSLLELVAGSVVVAHNARFDVSFLVAACAGAGLSWPSVRVLDTLALARQVLPRSEVRDHKLATLAAHLRAGTSPTHRALDDARATVDVLHALLARVGSLGVTSLEEVLAYSSRVPEPVRRKRHLAADVPSAPGAYLFRDERGEVLYVGSSVDLRARVRSYFTASETRSRMAEMVRLAAEVVPVVTETVLEARVRELRLIAEHDPRYNRRSRRPQAVPWLKLTVEPFPRLSVVRERRGDTGQGAAYLGPFRRAADAEAAAAALTTALPLRQCTRRLPVRPTPGAVACALADMGRCGAPCTGAQSRAAYAEVAAAAREAMTGDPAAVVAASSERMARLAGALRYEDAAAARERLTAFVRGAARAQRVGALAAVAELVAARRAATGGWELVCVRHGRLAGTTTSPRGADPRPFADALRATAERVDPGGGGAAGDGPAGGDSGLGGLAATVEETEQVLGWLEADGVRLVAVDGEWSSPVRAAGRLHRRRRAPEATPGP